MTDDEIRETLDALMRREVRLQGGATSDAGWSISATSDGSLLHSDWDGQERDVRFSTREDAERVLRRHGAAVVVELR